MSSTSIIAKIIEIYDRNIEFDQDFFKNETIRGIEHTVIKGKLTYIPDSCDHCNGENKDYMIVKNGNQIMHKHWARWKCILKTHSIYLQRVNCNSSESSKVQCFQGK